MLALPRALARAVTALAVLPLMAGVTAAPASAADPAHDPAVDCGVYWRYNGVLVYGGYAHVPATHQPQVRTLSVTCTYYNEVGAYTSTNAAPSPAVATFGTGLLGAGNMTVCASARVVYEDGHTAATPVTCS